MAETLAESSFPLTDAVLKQTHGLSGAEFVLLDSGGTLRASSVAEIDTTELPPGAGTNGPLRLVDVVNLGGQSYFHTTTTVGPRGAARAAAVAYFVSRARAAQARWQAVYPPLVVGSVLLVVVTVLAIVIAGRLMRGVVELRHQLSRLVQGDFQPIDVPQRNDELGDLVSVNVLGDELESWRRVIKRSERWRCWDNWPAGLRITSATADRRGSPCNCISGIVASIKTAWPWRCGSFRSPSRTCSSFSPLAARRRRGRIGASCAGGVRRASPRPTGVRASGRSLGGLGERGCHAALGGCEPVAASYS